MRKGEAAAKVQTEMQADFAYSVGENEELEKFFAGFVISLPGDDEGVIDEA